MKTIKQISADVYRTTLFRLIFAVAALGLMTAPLCAQLGIAVDTQETIVPTGFTATLAAFLSNNTPPITYTWSFNNQPIAGATNFLLNIFNAQSTNAGSYTLVVSNSSGSVTTAPPMTLEVTNIPTQAPSLQFSTLASFNRFVHGGFPQAGVIQGSDSYLYGTTVTGGSNATSDANGTVFKMSTNGAFIWSYEFNSSSGAATDNGLAPVGGLVQTSDGSLYGTTSLGGSSGFGTVFRMTTNGAFNLLYTFDLLGGLGGSPQGSLCVGSDGYLYGTTTTNSGANPGGTIFKMTTNGSLVWSFQLTNSTTGSVPFAGLVQGLDGGLYGTTFQGGISDAGTVFRISTNESFSLLYSFTNGVDGGLPEAGLVQVPDGQLYGSTTDGGNPNFDFGTIFKITTNGTFTLLVAFDGTNGNSPEASMIVGGDGNLYGTANEDGIGFNYEPNPDNLFAPVFGTIFQVTTNGTLTTLLSFDGSDNGNSPHATLFQGVDGGLYGTTSEGGTNNRSSSLLAFGDGTVFRLGIVPPSIQTTAISNHTFSFIWNAMPGVPYQAQYKDNLSQAQWMNVGSPVVGTNGIAGQSDNIGATNKTRFYRASYRF